MGCGVKEVTGSGRMVRMGKLGDVGVNVREGVRGGGVG